MNKNMILMALLIVLVVVSAVQAVQLNDLKEKVASGKIGTAKAPVSVQTGTGSGNSINDLPSMVGGC